MEMAVHSAPINVSFDQNNSCLTDGLNANSLSRRAIRADFLPQFVAHSKTSSLDLKNAFLGTYPTMW